MKNKKKMLICGATGFIGRNMLEYFSQKDEYEVSAVAFRTSPPLNQDKYPNVEWFYTDLNDRWDVKHITKDTDILLQFAATTSGAGDIVSKPYIHVTDNAIMNSLLLRSAYENGVEHFIFPSCTVMYQSSEKALREEDFDAGNELNSKYFGVGNTKVYLEKMCEFYSRLGKAKHTVIRHSNVYGPYDKYDYEKSHVFGATVRKVMDASGDVIVWGSGEEKRDLIHVQDLVRFVESAILHQESDYGLYNVGLGEAIAVKDLVQKIVRISGKDLQITHDLSKPTIKTSLFLDTNKAKNELGWAPEISLEQGIKMTLDWYKENCL